MVGLDLHAHCKTEKGAAEHGDREPGLPPLPFAENGAVSEYDGSHHPRQEGNSLHLGVVAHLDDLDVVGAESHRHRTGDSHESVHSQRKQQQERSKQTHKKIGGGTLALEEQ